MVGIDSTDFGMDPDWVQAFPLVTATPDLRSDLAIQGKCLEKSYQRSKMWLAGEDHAPYSSVFPAR